MGRPKTIDDEAMLAIAREVFVRDGAFGSTKEIAQRASISEAALFKRFTTKASLFLAAMVPPMVDANAIIAKAKKLNDPRDGILFIGEQILAFFREVLPVVLPLIRNPLIGVDAVHRHFGRDQVGRLTEVVAHYLQNEARKGRLGQINPFGAAALLITSMHSVAQFELMGFHDGAVPNDGVHALLDTLWEGLRPRERTKGPNRMSREKE